jgi:cobalt/nickel transport system permease protein
MSGQFSLADYIAVEEAQFGVKAHALRRMDARLKLALAAALIAVNVFIADWRLSTAVLGLAWLGLAASRTPFKQALWFILAPAWATALVIFGFSIGFGAEAIGSLGPLTFYREGLMQGLSAGLRVLSEMACAAALVLTTPFVQILKALRWYRVPEVLVETLGFMYRYIFLLVDEAAAMKSAALVRGGYATLISGFRTNGSIMAHIFIRAYDRSQRIAQAAQARGGE